MKTIILLISFLVFLNIHRVEALYDCKSERSEMAGLHNMILFGVPGDQLYSYHLPLFAGEVNGTHGHVHMHTYQGIWKVKLDDETTLSYEKKFNEQNVKKLQKPFFSFSPKGNKFKVPDMICSNSFQTDVLAAFGHIEGNSNFPPPEPLVNKLSKLTVDGGVVFARKFDGSSKEKLTYILFGTEKQQYLIHYLTDDENSFDQILTINVEEKLLMKLKKSSVLVSVPIDVNTNLKKIDNNSHEKNNKLYINHFLKNNIKVLSDGLVYDIEVTGVVYYNENGDVKVK
jgi:hypothetical protein